MNSVVKKNLFSLLSYLLLCATLLTINTVKAMAQKRDFSGTWKINKTKMDFGEYSENSIAIEIKVVQKKNTITIQRFSKNQGEEIHSYLEKMSLNGPTVKSMIASTLRKIANVELSLDSQTLTEIGNYADYASKVSYKITELWKLSEEGKTLTVFRTDERDDGKYSIRCVYQK